MHFMQSTTPSTPSENISPKRESGPELLDILGKSWDSAKQKAYAESRKPTACVHLLIDASVSMQDQRENLVCALSRYEQWLKQHLTQQSAIVRKLFAGCILDAQRETLADYRVITHSGYNPQALVQEYIRTHAHERDAVDCVYGTSLYSTLCEHLHTCCLEDPVPQVVLLFTDGEDTTHDETVRLRAKFWIQKLQIQGWLMCFLTTDPDGIATGESLGFTRGNILQFNDRQFPQAFQRLIHGTQKFLKSSEADRQLLLSQGVF